MQRSRREADNSHLVEDNFSTSGSDTFGDLFSQLGDVAIGGVVAVRRAKSSGSSWEKNLERSSDKEADRLTSHRSWLGEQRC